MRVDSATAAAGRFFEAWQYGDFRRGCKSKWGPPGGPHRHRPTTRRSGTAQPQAPVHTINHQLPESDSHNGTT